MADDPANTPKSRTDKGQWIKGSPSPNPSGRPKTNENLTQLAREYTQLAINTLVEIASNTEAREAARVKAAEVLLDRGYGTAPQTVNLGGEGLTAIVVRVLGAPA